MKSKMLAIAVVAVTSSVSLFSCSSSSKNEASGAGNASGDSFPHSQYWNCVVKARGKTFYGRAGNAIEARAQAFSECGEKFKSGECSPVLCEMKDSD